MAESNPFIESFLQGLREDSAQKMQKKQLEQQQAEFASRLGLSKDEFEERKKQAQTAQDWEASKLAVQYGGQLSDKPGVSGGQPNTTPDQGAPGVPQVGPMGRTQPEPQLVNPPTTGFDVSKTTSPNTSGPPVQADSINPFAAAMQALMGPQSQAGPPTGADTLGQPTPGLRINPTQSGAANEMIGQGAGQGGGGGAIAPGRTIQLPNGKILTLPPEPPTTFPVNVPGESEAAKWLGTGTRPLPLSVMPTIAQMIRDQAKPAPEGKKLGAEMLDRNAAALNAANKIGFQIKDKDNAYAEFLQAHPKEALEGLQSITTGKADPITEQLRQANINLTGMMIKQGNDQMLDGYVKAAKAGILDPTKVNDHIKGQLMNRLIGDPEYKAALSPIAQKAVAEIQPVLDQALDIKQALESRKFKYEGPGFMSTHQLGYNMGFAKGPDAELLGNLSLGRVLEVGRIIRGMSRAYGIYVKGEAHTPNPILDNKAEMIGKLNTIINQLTDASEQAQRMTKTGQILPAPKKGGIDLDSIYRQSKGIQ